MFRQASVLRFSFAQENIRRWWRDTFCGNCNNWICQTKIPERARDARTRTTLLFVAQENNHRRWARHVLRLSQDLDLPNNHYRIGTRRAKHTNRLYVFRYGDIRCGKHNSDLPHDNYKIGARSASTKQIIWLSVEEVNNHRWWARHKLRQS